MEEKAPGFHPWLVDLDPILAAAETNSVYECFWRRRRLHVHRLSDLLPDSIVRYVLQALGLLVAFIIIAMLCVNVGCFAVPVLMVLPLLIVQGRPRRRLHDTRMPRYVSNVFSASGFREQLAIDLYLAGCDGREVAESIYLEHRGRTWWMLPLCCVAVILMGILSMGMVGILFVPAGILGAGAIIYLGFEAVMLLTVAGSHFTCTWIVEPRTNAWGSEAPVSEAIGAALIKGFYAVAWMLLLAVFCWVFGLLLIAVEVLAAPLQAVGIVHGEYAIVGALLALVGLGMRFIRGHWIDTLHARCENLFRQAGPDFERFMVSTVLRDEDYDNWVRANEPPDWPDILRGLGSSEDRFPVLYPPDERK